MKYFKNTELAKLYNVSEKSVRNWIQAAADKKLDLELYIQNDRQHIANTPQNNLVIESLVQKGKKYKNSRSLKTVSPRPEFYGLCNSRQIFDLISSIEIHREIPHQYSYLDGGAEHWDKYAFKLLNEKTPNSITNTIELINLNLSYISAIAKQYKGVNVIDVGLGNCIPVRELLEYLLKENMLRRYIGIDISKDMLQVAERNINSWFGGKVKLEGYVKDINYDRFEDILIQDSFDHEHDSVLNLVLFFGGTISNLRDPDQALRIINNSMGHNDLFLVSRKLDTAATRRYFDFTVAQSELDIKERLVLDLMGIDQSYYNVEQFFDKEKMARIMQVKFNVGLSINFTIDGKKRIVELSKDDAVVIWRSDHKSLGETIDQLDRNNFDVLQATKSKDQQYSLFISKLQSAQI